MTTDTLRDSAERAFSVAMGATACLGASRSSNESKNHMATLKKAMGDFRTSMNAISSAHDADKARIAVLEVALKSIDDVRIKFLESAANRRNHSLEHSIGASEVFQGCANELNDALQVYRQELATQASEVE